MARSLRELHDREVLSQGVLPLVICGERYVFSVPSKRSLIRVETAGAEEEMITRIREVVSSGTVFFDVGANIGLTSICAVPAKYRARMAVYAFEPEPQNLSALSNNVQLNDLAESVQPVGLAVTSHDGNVSFEVHGETGTGTHRIKTSINSGGTVGEVLSVPAAALDSFCAGLGQVPTVIKIDVEGAECAVLDGMTGLLANKVLQHIFIEVHPAMLAAASIDPDSPRKRVTAAGFTVAWRASRGDQIHFHFVRT